VGNCGDRQSHRFAKCEAYVRAANLSAVPVQGGGQTKPKKQYLKCGGWLAGWLNRKKL
jgi:hypothetical protein